MEITSFLYIVTTVNFFVSGQLFPLDLLQSPWREMFKLLPFQYMAYFPAAVILGKVPTNELLPGLLIEAAWAAALAVLARCSTPAACAATALSEGETSVPRVPLLPAAGRLRPLLPD